MSKTKAIKLYVESTSTERDERMNYSTVQLRDERGSVIACAVLQTKHQDDDLHKRFTNAIKMIIE